MIPFTFFQSLLFWAGVVIFLSHRLFPSSLCFFELPTAPSAPALQLWARDSPSRQLGVGASSPAAERVCAGAAEPVTARWLADGKGRECSCRRFGCTRTEFHAAQPQLCQETRQREINRSTLRGNVCFWRCNFGELTFPSVLCSFCRVLCSLLTFPLIL